MKVINSKKVKYDAIVKEFTDVIKKYINHYVGSPSTARQIMGPVEVDQKNNTIKYTYYPIMPVKWIQIDLVLERPNED